jgi:hypothetical protein
MVVGQKTALGRTHRHQTVTVLVSETTLTVECGDESLTLLFLSNPQR